MKSRHALCGVVVLAVLGSAGPARGQTLFPTVANVTAGDTLSLWVTGLNTSTSLPPVRVYLFSEDPERLWAPPGPIVQALLFNAATTSYYYKSSIDFTDGVYLVGLKQDDNLFSPIRVHVVAAIYGIFWYDTAEITVRHPTLSFFPNPYTVQVGKTVPLVIRRTIEANAPLAFRLECSSASILGLNTNAAGGQNAASLELMFGTFEVSRTIYITGRSVGTINLKARVGSYETNVAVQVSQTLAQNDPDGDGVPNEWETLLGSNPFNAYSLDPGGVLTDGEWDSDGDGLSNHEEIVIYGTHPLRPDTDDDGVPDGAEVKQDITHPLHPMSSGLYRERSLDLSAIPTNGFTLPDPERFRVRDSGWTVECWIRPLSDGDGRVFSLEGAGGGHSFWVGLENFRPKAQILSGTNVMATAGGVGAFGSIQRLPTNEWTHVAWAWGPRDNSLKIFVNGVLLIAQETRAAPTFIAGTGVLARALSSGYLDEVRFWSYERSWEEVDHWNDRFYPAPAGYVREPEYGRSLGLYYRFDDGGNNTVDFAHLNDPAYFIPNTAALITTNRAVSLLGGDDEDGDLLPEWWTQVHNLDQYPELQYGPVFHYFDDDSNDVARVTYFKTFRAYTSIGNQVGWVQDVDSFYHFPKDNGLGPDGRHSAFTKYVYLHSVPKTATLRLFTPGMHTTIAYINGQRITPTNQIRRTQQNLDVAGYLKRGRNMIYVRCISLYDTWSDEARTQPIVDPDDPHFERAIGKFDAELIADGVALIVRGDVSRNDPRAVWFAQAWSTFWHMMYGGEVDPTAPDLENRHVPGNQDYGLPFDADTDQLNAWYEYLCGTNPRDDDSNNNGIPDGLEDFDDDGLVNREEQTRGTQPLLPDTDDDGVLDAVEVAAAHDPASAQSPAISRALAFDGGAATYAEMPMQRRFALDSWTLEAWVRLNPAETDGGILVQRIVGPNGINYELGLGDGATVPANVPYVRYVSVDGLVVQATGTVALAGGTNWTHVAGTYDADRRELKLYLNAVPVGTAPQALQSPALYAGGPVLHRIGLGLNGSVDDLRIWSVARTEAQIVAVFKKALQGSEPGLVAYYRADDSTSFQASPLVGTSANNGTNGAVNVLPWTWGQAQDYVRAYAGDWWNKWTHAATLRGGATFTAAGDGAIPIPPSLRVTLLPPEAVTDGAQWAIQGIGSWRDSGATVYEDLPPGEQMVLFKSIAGWTAPSNRTVYLTNGVTTVLTETYLRHGGLRVDLTFADEATHGLIWPVTGAQWRVAGGLWKNDGETLGNLTPGSYLVEFKEINGWLRPDPISVTILSGETKLLLAPYVPATAAVRALIEPARVVSLGARWQLDAGPWNASGDTLTGVSLGDHTVYFTNLPPWITPAPIAVWLSNTNVVTVTGRYAQVTGLYVEIEPPGAIAAGAQWRVSGGTWYASHTVQAIPAGPCTVEFKSVPGWGPAPDIPTAVTSGVTTLLLATYWPMEVYGPLGTTNAVITIGLNEPRGLAFDALRRLYIADSGNHRIAILDTRDNSVTNLGAAGTAAGQFNQPFGVVLDAATNLYVADMGNNRVQRRSAAGTWTVWGGTSPSTNLGAFNAPYDVAVDAFTNLYVTDRSNYRVQKRTPAGAWSVFVGNGFADGFVRVSKGVTVDASNNVVVSDHHYPSAEYSRIQVFRTNGTLLARIGSSDAGEGGLARPQRMAFGRTNDLYVADMNNNRVVRRQANGSWQTILGGNVLNHPEGVAWDARGYLYIADTANHRIIRLQLWKSPHIPPTFSQTLPGPGGVTISWMGTAGWFYTVQYTDNLADPNAWTDLGGCVGMPGVEAVMSCTDTANTGLPNRYYRVLAY